MISSNNFPMKEKETCLQKISADKSRHFMLSQIIPYQYVDFAAPEDADYSLIVLSSLLYGSFLVKK